MKCIIGIGNPGRKYEKNRHNVGWMVLDRVASAHQLRFSKRAGTYAAAVWPCGSEKVFLLKPTSFVNRSGDAVRAFCSEHSDVTFADLLVVLDDVNLALGRMRFRTQGSSGGHHGLESVIEAAGSGRFARLRLGIGAENLAGRELTSHVLGDFGAEELPLVRSVTDRAAKACEDWITKGSEAVMRLYNVKVQHASGSSQKSGGKKNESNG